MKILTTTILALFLGAIVPSAAGAFMKDGCGGGACSDCHSITREEAGKILGGLVDNVVSISESPVGGLWLLEVEKGGKHGPIYLDYSKDFVISGQILQISSMANVTGAHSAPLSRVDPAEIPLEGSLRVGKKSAKMKVIVFSDPDCHFCGTLHAELKKVAEKDPNVAFHIKLYSRNNNPVSIRKAISVVCSKSPKLLEEAYAGKEIPPPPPSCKDTTVEETAQLAGKLTIRGTPTLVLPDGRVVRGYRDAETLRKLIREKEPAPVSKQGRNSP